MKDCKYCLCCNCEHHSHSCCDCDICENEDITVFTCNKYKEKDDNNSKVITNWCIKGSVGEFFEYTIAYSEGKFYEYWPY